jgi:imidazolonepropionase-like amidohydrolase
MRLALSIALAASLGTTAYAQSRGPVLYQGARLITGDGGPPINSGDFVVEDGRITAIGAKGTVRAPSSATRMDLTGKTVMPAMVNVHVHIGYEGYTTWRAENYTAENVLDHLEREAFYGTGTTQSVGTSPTDTSIQFQKDQRAGKFPPAAQFFFIPGMAPPNGGPDQVLRVATNKLHVIYEVSNAEEARTAVRGMNAKGIKAVKMWVDDRGGTYPKLSPETFTAIIDEAHKHGMIVHTHATTLPDQKAVVRAGTDVLVHMVQNQKIDDELMTLLKEHKPYWATVLGLGDPTAVCQHDPFFEQSLPDATIATIRATMDRKPLAPSCGPASPRAGQREEIMAYNFPRMVSSGAQVVLGTDTGIEPGHTFGSGDHLEIARWVQLGLTPAQAIVAATSRPAQLLRLTDRGMLAVNKRADFIVLDANPLDDIHNTRKISAVYLNGAKLDREALQRKFKKG